MSDYTGVMSNTIRTIIDNNESLLAAVRYDAIQSVRYDFGYRDLDAETYAGVYRDYSYDLATHLAHVVRDAVMEATNANADSVDLGSRVLAELLDTGGAYLWADIAEVYIPTPDDYAEYLESAA